MFSHISVCLLVGLQARLHKKKNYWIDFLTFCDIARCKFKSESWEFQFILWCTRQVRTLLSAILFWLFDEEGAQFFTFLTHKKKKVIQYNTIQYTLTTQQNTSNKTSRFYKICVNQWFHLKCLNLWNCSTLLYNLVCVPEMSNLITELPRIGALLQSHLCPSF